MQGKLSGFGILALFLIMIVPVYAEVSEFSIEKSFYTNDEGVVFVGTEDVGSKIVTVLVTDPKGKESMLVSAMSNSDGVFQTIPKNVDDFFSIIGTYQFTAFTIQKDNSKNISLEFDGNKIFEPSKYLLELNPIKNKIIEVEKTVTFTASIKDNSATDVIYTLENATTGLENTTTGATIDPSTGKFVWTPSKSYGSYKDVIYNFDIIVKHDNQEDRENISITVKKAYDEPVIEPNVEPVIEPNVEPVIEPNVEPVIEPNVEQTKSTVASFVDVTKDPQSYVERYNDESTYKEWFDENYSQYSSIYEAVGLEEPEFGICGDGTKLINGVCTIIQKMIEKPWWQFW
jgi:hypothetical protein